jgi:hypothetical protein
MSVDPANQGIKSIAVEAVVTRADGTVEDQGVVAEWHADEPEKNKGLIEGLGLFTYFKGLVNGTTSS